MLEILKNRLLKSFYVHSASLRNRSVRLSPSLVPLLRDGLLPRRNKRHQAW